MSKTVTTTSNFVTAEFNAATLNKRITDVIEQIKELVELANKFTTYPMPSLNHETRPTKYMELAQLLNFVLEVRRQVRFDIQGYIEEINKIQEEADKKIKGYVKPTLAPINS